MTDSHAPRSLTEDQMALIVRRAVLDVIGELAGLGLTHGEQKEANMAKISAAFQMALALVDIRQLGMRFCLRCIWRGVALSVFATVGFAVAYYADRFPVFRALMIRLGVM